MRHKNDEQIEKELEWYMIDDADSFNHGGADIKSDREWKKWTKSHTNDEHVSEEFFENFFPCMNINSKSLDEHNSSRNSPYCSSVQHEK